jgi:hypothetical protein
MTPPTSSSSWPASWFSKPLAWAQEQAAWIAAEVADDINQAQKEIDEANLAASEAINPLPPESPITSPPSSPNLAIVDSSLVFREPAAEPTLRPPPEAPSLWTWASKSVAWIQEEWNDTEISTEEKPLATPGSPPSSPSEPIAEEDSPLPSSTQLISNIHHQVIVDGRNINPLSRTLTKEAAHTNKEIAEIIIAINENTLKPKNPRPEEILGALIIPSVIPSPLVDNKPNEDVKKVAAEELKKLQTETNQERSTLINHITAYTTLQFLHEWAAGETPAESFNTYRPVLEKYQKQLLLAKEKNQPKPSLWTLYNETFGVKLTFFQKTKAALCYFLFFFATGLVPNAVSAFTNHFINSLRKDLTTTPNISSLTSKFLTQTSIILTKYKAALEECAAQKGALGTPEQCKEKAVNELMTEPLDQIIAEVSNIFVDQFFPRLKLCTKWKKSSFFLIRWAGICLSALLEGPINWVIKRVLKKNALPAVFHAIVDNTASESPQISLVFSRAIYQEANKQLLSFQAKLAREEPEDPTPLLQLPPHDKKKLASVAKLLISVLGMTPHENIDDLIQHIAKQKNDSSDILREALELGIEKIAHIALAQLHDRNHIEEILSKILKASNEAFLNSETFEQIQQSELTQKKALEMASKEVFHTIVRRSIREKIEPSFKPIAAQTNAIHSELRKNILIKIADLQNLFLRTANKTFNTENAQLLESQTIFQEIKLFCERMEELRLLMNVSCMNANTPGLTEALKEELDRILQPAREKSLHLLESIGRLKHYQQENKQNAHTTHALQEIFSFNEEASRLILEDTPNALESQFRHLNQLVSELTPHLPKEAKEKLTLLTENLVQSLKDYIDQHAGLEKLHLLVKTDGPIANLVIVRQGGTVPNFHVGLAKNTIEDILKTLPPGQKDELTKDLNRMLSKLPTASYQWSTLKAFLLDQLPPQLQNRAGERLNAYFQKMPRGSKIPEHEWKGYEANFLAEFTLEEQELIRPLLKQIYYFLSYDSILHAYGINFHQKIIKYCEPYAQARDEAYQTYAANSEEIYLLTTELTPPALEKRQASYAEMLRELKWIQKEINELETIAQNLTLQKPHDLKLLATAAGGVLGAPVGLLTTAVLGTTLGPLGILAGSVATTFAMNYYNEHRTEETAKGMAAGLFGAAAAALGDTILPGIGTLVGGIAGAANGAFAGSKVPDLVLDWGDEVIVRQLEQWLDNVLLEATNTNTRKIASYSFLQTFAKAYRRTAF